jgi:NAD(P)-dependent dehydrogenase (short-subunit alcohol dehydrogenase family)
MQLDNKVAIITGGGSGIGSATAERFAKEGAQVIIADRDESRAGMVTDKIHLEGNQAICITTDISQEGDVEKLIRSVEDKYGKIDILVNNAAVFVLKPISATVDEWNKVLSVNVIGTALCTKYVVEAMKKNNAGAIINVASISGVVAQPNQLTYNVTKAGIIEMTKCLALDLAKYNIRVNCVSPGNVQTEGLESALEYHQLSKKDVENACILKRIAHPKEIASAILFMATDENSSYITGENLMVDGGYTTI